ncbi:hypothetical protein AJ79_01400 [Helicocarpus griseus UAMH5409]|uniref:Shugoshin C-terminal domain-containing protein n=1 Tax=Helicocarpus griseus UAMH5409 TaxID=1447875 RepID=A0A2B7Y669_9EURO|nr:hypothetical protein AJ79_01400 [Helicocarpus griseus UAMH5409]
MARLNDLPAAAESVESLKRRFIRQNREIARANSMQSLRIRTLESDVARLLAENVALREEIITVNQELERYQHNQQLGAEIDTLKSKLDSKLAEFGSLIADLGSLPRRRGLSSEPRQKSDDRVVQISPEAARRRSMVKVARENAGTDEGRLPAILEDKYYPRLTLESEDIAELMSSEGAESNSPDITATPISQSAMPASVDSFIDDEPSMIAKTNEDTIQPLLSISSSGARRKRRDSSLLNGTPRGTEMEAKEQEFVPIHISKSGSKRKLSVRDDEDFASQDLNDDDDFQFTRLTGPSNFISRDSGAESEGTPTKATAHKSSTQRKDRPTVRRALGPKSTNLKQISSPTKKVSGTAAAWEKEIPKPNPKPPKNRSSDLNEKSVSTIPSGPNKPRKHEFVDIDLWPQQPQVEEIREIPEKNTAELDTAAFLSTEPPESCQETRDAPPPSSSGTSRPSRRSRGSVSYAEPNLRDKMRRPTKELVDAVTGEARFRRTSKSDLGSSDERNHNFDTATGEDSITSTAYNDSCTSLDNSMIELPSNVMSNRKRRTLSANKFDIGGAPETGQSPSSVAISTLMAGSKRRSHQPKDSDNLGTEQNDASGTTARNSRRHSSNPTAAATSSRSRRSQSSTTLAKENAADIQAALESAGFGAKNSKGGDIAANGVSEFDYNAFLDAQEGASEVKRIQRLAASRRRSMML